MAAAQGSNQWRAAAGPPPPPRTLNVHKFAESRAAELESLHSIVANRLNNDFRSRRSKRRRTTGYDNRVAKKRNFKRRKLGGGIEKKKDKSDGVVDDLESEKDSKEKKLPRRIRRRIELKKNPESGFCSSGDGTKRLRTHVWHAKRFTMTKLWGFYLPLGLQGRGRGSRAVLKWYKQGAVVHDASYYNAAQLEGPEDVLFSILCMVLTPPPLPCADDAFRRSHSGDAYLSAILHHAGAGHQMICPVTYMWRPFHLQDSGIGALHKSNNENNTELETECPTNLRQLWIWMHPSAFTEGYDALKFACQEKLSETGVLVDCVSLEGQLARLEIMGIKAFQLLQKILDPVTCSLEDSWQLNKSLVAEADSGHKIGQHVLQKDCFSPYAVMPLTVADPRSLREKRFTEGPAYLASNLVDGSMDKNSHHYTSTGDFNMNQEVPSTLQSNPENKCAVSNCKDLWGASRGIQPPLEENFLCMERHCKCLDFFCLKDGYSRTSNMTAKVHDSRLCHIVLVRNSKQAGSLEGWSIILPLSWVRAFWIPLVSHGAHAIGLREKHWIACDVGLPCFPSDFPDCNAYSCFKATEAEAINQKMELRPLALRPFKVPIIPPWNSIYNAFDNHSLQVKGTPSNYIVSGGSLLEESNGETADLPSVPPNGLSRKLFVARTSKMLNQFMNEICGCHLLLFPYESDGKVFSKFIKDEAKISQASTDSWITSGHWRLCYLRVLLHACREGVFEEGAVVSAPYYSDLAIWTSSSKDNDAKLQISESFLSSYFTEQPSGTWEFQLPEDSVSKESYRWPIGFVTTGFVRGSKKPVAVALCEAVLLARLRQEQWSRIPVKRRRKEIFVLVRNLRSTAYRLALATIVIEGQEEDVEYL
ncbi:hypothetical protein Ancab_022511 [Ancistrocladus abbreviatus]